MVFLTRESVELMNEKEVRARALNFSNMCRVQMQVIKTQEAQLKKMAEELGSRHQLVLFAQEQLDQLKKTVFGASSERRVSPDQASLFDPPSHAVEEPANEPVKDKKKRKKFGRTPQKELPRVEILHVLSDEEIEKQGLEAIKGQFEDSEVINISPSSFQVEIHRRQKYRKKARVFSVKINNTEENLPEENDTIVTAAGVLKLLEGSRYSIEFAVSVGIRKYAWHLPLDRQARMMSAKGLVVTSQVLFKQIDNVSWLKK